jgi:hypothetical protein
MTVGFCREFIGQSDSNPRPLRDVVEAVPHPPSDSGGVHQTGDPLDAVRHGCSPVKATHHEFWDVGHWLAAEARGL